MPTHARHYATGELVTLDAGRVASVGPPRRPADALPWVAPAFFDVQINGGLGIAFNGPDLTPERVRTVADLCRAHGIGGFLPTVITDGFEPIRRAFAALRSAVEGDAELARRIPGYHLEGPYLSADDGPRGAHPRAFTRDPDWDEFRRWQDAADGRIRMVTVAPERDAMPAFVHRLARAGVVVALGHTAATGDQIRAAVDAGARTSTHLGNGCAATLPRHSNPIWEQVADDRLTMSVIADGHHLPPAVLRTLVRAKGVGRTLLTCDAGSLAGSPPGRYREWGADLDVLPGGKIVVAGTPFLAGGGHFTDRCVGTAIRDAGVSLADAVDMASVRPRHLLGLSVPAVAAGAAADELVVFDWEPGGDVTVRAVGGPIHQTRVTP